MEQNDIAKQRQLEVRAMPVAQLRAIRLGTYRTCINCESWGPNVIKKGDAPVEECTKAPGMRPPALVIVLGCDEWVEDIPF